MALEGCKEGFGWSSTKCVECEIEAENVHNCNTSLTAISSCKAGYVVSDDNESCEPCADNCYDCDETLMCDICNPGWTVNEDNDACIECS